MIEIDISENLSIRKDDEDTFIVGAPDEVYVDENGGGRGMVKIRTGDIQSLIRALKTMQLAPED